MIYAKNGIYTVKKDLSAHYFVYRKRTKIARFLSLSDAIKHMKKLNQ